MTGWALGSWVAALGGTASQLFALGILGLRQ